MNCLIIDGQNNHDWAATTPVLSEILTKAGHSVTVITTPAEGAPADAWDAFSPDFVSFDVVVSNYCDINPEGVPWPTSVIDRLCDWVESGGGFVAFHAAAAAFPKHDRYWQMIGVGWQDQAGHGEREPYEVQIVETEHPITSGVSPAFDHAMDELWFGLTGPATQGEVTMNTLALAPCPITGKDEPLLWTLTPGQGRTFITVLGHDPEAMSSSGFEHTFIQGCRWAAQEI